MDVKDASGKAVIDKPQGNGSNNYFPALSQCSVHSQGFPSLRI